jgi:GntR family transcriptional regulator/MocR family aminotransferase
MTRPVGGWELSLATQPAGGARLPAFLRIARAIAEDARRGRLTPGSRLPGSRELARSLGVHRNTVLAAYAELAAEGFLEASAGRGTYLKRSLPEVKPRRWQTPSPDAPSPSRARLGFAFDTPHTEPLGVRPPRGALTLFGGVPDIRLAPREALARAQRRALRLHPELLSYGDARGEPSLRAALAEMLRARRGLLVEADDILITRGSQMALALIGRLLLRPGDLVAVEELGYRPAWRALGRAAAPSAHADPRAGLRPVPLDAEGLRIDALEALCAREPVRAVYLTPHHQYPSTVTLSAARRMALLELARRRRIAIIEDDYDHEFHYEGRPVLPLASADRAGVVLYVGTLSKVLAPGLRIGYLVAPTPVRDAALALRFDLDRQGDRVGEHALAELMEDGELQRHLRRTRRVYQARRDHVVALLREQLGEWLDFEVPAGGMALWAKVAAGLPVAPWLARAEQLGVFTQAGRLFTFDGRERQRVRLGYAAHTEQELTSAVTRLRKAALEVRRAARSA